MFDMQLPSAEKQKYNHKWDWRYLSQNPSLPWSIEFIKKYNHKWDWSDFPRNIILSYLHQEISLHSINKIFIYD